LALSGKELAHKLLPWGNALFWTDLYTSITGVTHFRKGEDYTWQHSDGVKMADLFTLAAKGTTLLVYLGHHAVDGLFFFYRDIFKEEMGVGFFYIGI